MQPDSSENWLISTLEHQGFRGNQWWLNASLLGLIFCPRRLDTRSLSHILSKSYPKFSWQWPDTDHLAHRTAPETWELAERSRTRTEDWSWSCSRRIARGTPAGSSAGRCSAPAASDRSSWPSSGGSRGPGARPLSSSRPGSSSGLSDSDSIYWCCFDYFTCCSNSLSLGPCPWSSASWSCSCSCSCRCWSTSRSSWFEYLL